MRIATLAMALLVLTSCNPLRKVQRTEKVDTAITDRSEIHKIVNEVIREQGKFLQTIIEFYPPVITPVVPEPRDIDGGGELSQALPSTSPQAPPDQPVKRIITTEISHERDHRIDVDSTAHNDIQSTAHTDVVEKINEKPPPSVMWIKWVAIALLALLGLVILFKFFR